MKRFIMIGAILLLVMLAVSPASAGIWHNGKYFGNENEYNDYIGNSQVYHDPVTGTDSKYRAVDNGVNTYQYSCDIHGSIRAHVNTLTPSLLLSNDADPDKTETVLIDASGNFEYPGLAYGNYTLTLPMGTGNGGQIETSKVVCGAPGGIVYPQTDLLGMGVSITSNIESVAPVDPTQKINICVATYYPDKSKEPIDGHVKLTWKNLFGVANVRSAAQSLVNDGQTSFEVSNSNLGGDPAYGWYKKLSVTYTVDESCLPVCTKCHCDWPTYHYATADEYSIITLN